MGKSKKVKINKSFIEGVVLGIIAADRQNKEKKPVNVEKSFWRKDDDYGYELWVKINGKISDFTLNILTETFNKLMPFHCITHIFASSDGYIVFRPTYEVMSFFVEKEFTGINK